MKTKNGTPACDRPPRLRAPEETGGGCPARGCDRSINSLSSPSLCLPAGMGGAEWARPQAWKGAPVGDSDRMPTTRGQRQGGVPTTGGTSSQAGHPRFLGSGWREGSGAGLAVEDERWSGQLLLLLLPAPPLLHGCAEGLTQPILRPRTFPVSDPGAFVPAVMRPGGGVEGWC